MKLEWQATAGSERPNDVLVTVSPADSGSGLSVRIRSVVEKQFGAAIRATADAILAEHAIEDAHVEFADCGAFDFTIRARLRAALSRAGVVTAAGGHG